MRRCRPGNRGRPTASSVTDEEAAYGLVLTAPAQRAIADRLPEAVAAAVTDFLTVSLIAEPHRVGKPLRGNLAGVWSARRGTYRILYRIRDDRREVVVLGIEHRYDAYRPL